MSGPLCRAAARRRRLPRRAHAAEGGCRALAVLAQHPRRALSRSRHAGAGNRHGGAEARPAGADDACRPCRQARHAAGLQPAGRPVDTLHLHHRAGHDAVSDSDQFGQLFPGPQRAGRRRHRPDRRQGRRSGAAHHAGANRKGQARRTGARPARLLFRQPHQGAADLRRHLRRLLGRRRTTPKARPIHCRRYRRRRWWASPMPRR